MREEVRHEVQAIFAQYSGPLPHPDLLAGFEHVLPGSAERIVRMTEREQSQRHELETRQVRDAFWLGLTGQVFGLVVSVAGFALAGFAAYRGEQAVAVAVAGASLAALAGVFVYGRRALQDQ